MHDQNPPIAHRDIKVENILLQNKKFKLCDFGSASIQTLDYSSSAQTQNHVDQMMEDFEKYTTLMYRPPEMIDKYKKFTVNCQADVWVNYFSFQLMYKFDYRCLAVWLTPSVSFSIHSKKLKSQLLSMLTTLCRRNLPTESLIK